MVDDVRALIAELREPWTADSAGAAVDRMERAADALELVKAERDSLAEVNRSLITRAVGAEDSNALLHEDVAALTTRIEKALAVHEPRRHDDTNFWVGEPFTECRRCLTLWPCETVRILKGES